MGKKKVKEPDGPPKDEFDPVELITKKPQTVVLMLQSQEENVLIAVCEALYKYADKAQENKSQLLTFGALELLIKLLNHEDKLVKRNAIMCVGTMASEIGARRTMRKHGSVPLLLNLLGPEEDVLCHEFATLALSWLAEEYISKNEIFEKHGLPQLIQHLQSTDCDVQRNSVKAIALLLEDFQCRAAFKDLNGVEPLLKLLDSDFPVIQDLALSALITCSQDGDCRTAIRELEGLSKLVTIIGEEVMSDLHIPSLKCLANCLEDSENLKFIQSTGVFDKLLAFIADSPNSEIQQYATSVIAAAAKKDENRKVFHEQESEKTLLSLLNTENIGVTVASLKALAMMAENLSSRDKIGKQDGIPLIIPYLKNENVDAREYASLALANLTTANQPNSQSIMDKNAIDSLIKLLNDKSTSSIQSNAAACLSNLTCNEAWRCEIQRHGVIKGLLNALHSSDTEVQIRGCQALASFFCDRESRVQLLIENGLPRLIELVQSNHEGVRRNASWLIALCAIDSDIAREVIKCGGLSVLQEINLSSRQSKFSEAALNKLLNTNLSAKYALTGTLSYDNIIDDIFYDTGKINPSADFVTLEELCKEPVNQRRPVIVVTIQKEPKELSSDLKNPPPTVTQPAKPTAEKPNEKSRGRTRTESRRNSNSKQRPSREREEAANDLTEKTASDPVPPKIELPVFTLPEDKLLNKFIGEVQANIFPVGPADLQIRSLAEYVSDAMGGFVDKGDLTKFSYELHISGLKAELNSNVIPIGRIEKGIYYHRALLFKLHFFPERIGFAFIMISEIFGEWNKVLADKILIPSSLVRGEYGRAWNEVQICQVNEEHGQTIFPPKLFIVDLMHEPGRLFPSGSPDAVAYQRI